MATVRGRLIALRFILLAYCFIMLLMRPIMYYYATTAARSLHVCLNNNFDYSCTCSTMRLPCMMRANLRLEITRFSTHAGRACSGNNRDNNCDAVLVFVCYWCRWLRVLWYCIFLCPLEMKLFVLFLCIFILIRLALTVIGLQITFEVFSCFNVRRWSTYGGIQSSETDGQYSQSHRSRDDIGRWLWTLMIINSINRCRAGNKWAD